MKKTFLLFLIISLCSFIVKAQLKATLTPTNFCFGTNGNITANPSGGTKPYTYLWSNAATTQSITNVTAGKYFVTVTDSVASTVVDSISITAASASLVLSNLSVVNLRCNGVSRGEIKNSITGGIAPYHYVWSSQTKDSLNNSSLAAGTYTITVTDANGCTDTTTATLTQPAGTKLTLTNKSVVNERCPGDSIGEIKDSVSGGTGPYHYAWSRQTKDSINNSHLASSNSYRCTVTDANGCTASVTMAVTAPATIRFTTTLVNEPCNGDSKGAIKNTITGGTTPYTNYAWSSQTKDSSNNSALPVGSYTITVTDSRGCTAMKTSTITQPNILVLSKSSVVNEPCNGDSKGKIKNTVSGGTAVYHYVWSSQTKDSVNNSALLPGTYTITVTDAHSCTDTTIATITEPAALTATSIVTNATIQNNDGSIAVNPSGGTSPYKYSLNGGKDTTLNTFTGLAAGKDTVTVKDANGCIFSVIDSVGITTGISSILGNNTIKLFPNPVRDIINVSGIDKTAILTLTDICGKILLVKEIINDEKIAVNALPSGVYFLKITTSKDLIVKKFIKE